MLNRDRMPVFGTCHLSQGFNQLPRPYYKIQMNEGRDRREAVRTTVASYWPPLQSLEPL